MRSSVNCRAEPKYWRLITASAWLSRWPAGTRSARYRTKLGTGRARPELYAYGRKRGWPVTVSKGTEERDREYSAFVRFVKTLKDEFPEGVPAQYGQETTLAKEILIATPQLRGTNSL